MLARPPWGVGLVMRGLATKVPKKGTPPPPPAKGGKKPQVAAAPQQAKGAPKLELGVEMSPLDSNAAFGKFQTIFSGHKASKILQDKAIPKNLRDQFGLFQSEALLFRQAEKNFVEQIATNPSSCPHLLLDGKVGGGKTAALLQIANYAVSQKWLVFYVPNVRSFVNGTSSIFKQQGTQSYSQPEASLHLAGLLQLLNPVFFEKMKLQNDHRLGETFTAAGRKLVTVTRGMTLNKLIETAVQNPQQAGAALVVLLEELSAQQDTPMLLAVDDVNYLFASTSYDDPDDSHPFKKKKLHATRFLFLDKLKKLVSGEQKFSQGGIVASTTRSLDNTMLRDGIMQLEYELPSLKGLKVADVPNLNRKELGTCIWHYQGLGFVPKTDDLASSEMTYHRLRLLTAGNPRELFKVVTSFT